MITFIIILLAIQYALFLIIVLLIIIEPDTYILETKEQWIVFGFPFAIYAKLVWMFMIFIASIPERWNKLPDK